MPHTRLRRSLLLLCVAAVVGGALTGATAPDGSAFAAGSDDSTHLTTREAWAWPLAAPFRLDRPYIAPASEYGPGHRGVDVLAMGATVVQAPASGIVAFAGSVAGRGVVTIDHGDGLVSTLEPVDPTVDAGTAITRGDAVGALSIGGHAAAGRLHLGVRRDGEYINPMLLLGGVARAVLLPCCD